MHCYVNNHLSCCMCFTAFIGGITIVPLYFDESSIIWFDIRFHFYLPAFSSLFHSFPAQFHSFFNQFEVECMFHPFQSCSTMFNPYFETFLPSEQHLLVAEKGVFLRARNCKATLGGPDLRSCLKNGRFPPKTGHQEKIMGDRGK